MPRTDSCPRHRDEPAAPKLTQGGIIRHDVGLVHVGEQPDGCVVPAERPIDLVDRTVPDASALYAQRPCNRPDCPCGGHRG